MVERSSRGENNCSLIITFLLDLICVVAGSFEMKGFDNRELVKINCMEKWGMVWLRDRFCYIIIATAVKSLWLLLFVLLHSFFFFFFAH